MYIIASKKLVEIDIEDFEDVSGIEWKIDAHGYAYFDPRGSCKRVLMHRLISRAPADMVVDHVNGEPADNRRSNLRICTHAQNMRNRKTSKANKTGFKGVYAVRGRWASQIQFEGKGIHLGTFRSPEEAHLAYCEAAKRYHGEFARFS